MDHLIVGLLAIILCGCIATFVVGPLLPYGIGRAVMLVASYPLAAVAVCAFVGLVIFGIYQIIVGLMLLGQ